MSGLPLVPHPDVVQARGLVELFEEVGVLLARPRPVVRLGVSRLLSGLAFWGSGVVSSSYL